MMNKDMMRAHRSAVMRGKRKLADKLLNKIINTDRTEDKLPIECAVSMHQGCVYLLRMSKHEYKLYWMKYHLKLVRQGKLDDAWCVMTLHFRNFDSCFDSEQHCLLSNLRCSLDRIMA